MFFPSKCSSLRSEKMNIFARNGLLSSASCVAFFILAAGSASAGELRDKIQTELDSSPFLHRQQVKMRVLEERDGCVIIELVNGPKKLRDAFRKGIELGGAGLVNPKLREDTRNALWSIRKTIRAIERFKEIKEITLTGALNGQQDQAEAVYDEACEQMDRSEWNTRGDSVPLLAQAAQMGFAPAQYDLAKILTAGSIVPQDDAQAAFWYRKAAEQGHAPAQFNFGKMCAMGVGMKKDCTQALEWFQKAAAQDHDQDMQIKGLNALATLLATWPEENLRDGKAALAYAQKALALASASDVSTPYRAALLQTFASACARCGRFQEAVEQQKGVILQLEGVNSIATAEKEQLLADAKNRLSLFQNHQAYVGRE